MEKLGIGFPIISKLIAQKHGDLKTFPTNIILVKKSHEKNSICGFLS